MEYSKELQVACAAGGIYLNDCSGAHCTLQGKSLPSHTFRSNPVTAQLIRMHGPWHAAVRLVARHLHDHTLKQGTASYDGGDDEGEDHNWAGEVAFPDPLYIEELQTRVWCMALPRPQQNSINHFRLA